MNKNFIVIPVVLVVLVVMVVLVALVVPHLEITNIRSSGEL